jgi:predicted ATPase/class 3 adenylate cyclase
VHDPSPITTFLFTDIEGSTRLWDEVPERMRTALARHDHLVRAAVEGHRGTVVKMTGDGVSAVFHDPVDALTAAVAIQCTLLDPDATDGLALRVRCGLHAGVVEGRDDDYYGRPVNRAARIMGAAHGGQVLLSQTVALLVQEHLPRGVALRDLGSVRLRDLASPEHIYQLTHPQLRREFPALRSLAATPNNLPRQVTSFIGRERELAEVRQLLGKTRLLTLLGMGGLGKTRLSLQAAADAMDDYPDGVWVVELSTLADERLVPQAAASVLGVKEEAGRPVVEALVKHVRERRLLIVLDNCERLLLACANLAKELLRAGPDLKVLATSREPLRVTGETNYPLSPLAVPGHEPGGPPEALTQYPAVQLFVDRAVAAQPGFRLSAQNAKTVADICRQLDGLPLAIELAAARTRALSVEKIAERLGDRFRVLTGGDRTAEPRQQTLRACIDWSHDLLSDPERALLRRFAVFAGGLTLEAAEAVGADGKLIVEEDVVDLVTRLVEKSLAILEVEQERYRLLETVRQYAEDRLDESEEAADVRTRHLIFYATLAEKARPELLGPAQAAWLARLDLERENVLAAHAWADHMADGGDLGLTLVHSIKHYWFSRGLLELGYRVTVEALSRANAEERSLSRCRGLFNAGQFCYLMGRYKDVHGYLEQSLAIGRDLGDRGRIEMVLQLLGIVALNQGDLRTARAYLDEALPLAEQVGDKRELCAVINARAHLHRLGGELDTAESLYGKVLAFARELGDRESIAIALLNLTIVSILRASGDTARDMLAQVLLIVEETGSQSSAQSLLAVSSGLASLRGEWEHAARFFGMAEKQAAQTGMYPDPVDEASLAPLIARTREVLGTDEFQIAATRGRWLLLAEAMAEVRAWLEVRTPAISPT